ncbi:hypothetical protein HOY82DRAFT_602012 [Tuber indicum]|nr:hypothetical protein HOY82DRAFT_602012 [Tuber indicum]
MVYGCYFSLIVLALGFMIAPIAAVSTDDCNTAITKEQAKALRTWTVESVRAVTYALETDPVLGDVAKAGTDIWGQKPGVQGKEWVAVVLQRAQLALNAQKAFLKGKGEKPGILGFPQGWAEALESEDEKVYNGEYLSQDKKSVLAAAFVGAGLEEGGAKEAAKLVWGRLHSSDSANISSV